MWYMYDAEEDRKLKLQFQNLKSQIDILKMQGGKTTETERKLNALRDQIRVATLPKLHGLKHTYNAVRMKRKQVIASGAGDLSSILYLTEKLDYLHSAIGQCLDFARSFDIEIK